MPANLTPEYKDAEAQYRGAVTREEKIAALERMLRVIPKHKGTDKLQADLRSRLSRLKREPKKKGARGHSHKVPHEGAGQVVLVGPPNAGKSSLVASLTHANPEVASYPMTTREAIPGMMPYKDVAFQLVDLPPVCEEHVEPWVYDVVRGGDLVWLVVSIERPLVGVEVALELLQEKAIGLQPAGAAVPEDARPGWLYKDTLLVVTGMDRDGADGDLEALLELLEIQWPTVPVSTVAELGLEQLGKQTFDALDIMRIYTKEPGKEADMTQPFTLRRGSTVGDLARSIHKDVADGLKFARVWGPSAFDGQSVKVAHVLEEGDVVEIHW
ncbi:MAG: TGS domain-containing protein [Gemmatimonadota bacterium]|nr:MAG: TGS domain-containing protein [Gemmatimonadota bacterium]